MAADHARVFGERTLDALLKSADAKHLGEHPDLPLRVWWLQTHLIPLV
jgi:hypothetical protein